MSAGRVVVVTGCTRGMGRKLVEHLYKDEKVAHIIGIGRDGENMKSLAETLGIKKYGIQDVHVKAFLFVADVTKSDQIQRVADQLKNTGIVPDLLVNNAAILGPVKPTWLVSIEEFSKAFDTNVVGVHNVMRSFIPLMKDTKGAVMVNISSGWGRSVSPNFSTYCATKWAVEGLTKAAATDLEGTQMAIVSLAPGIIDTDMLKEASISISGLPLDEWIKKFPKIIMSLTKADNGKQLSFSENL